MSHTTTYTTTETLPDDLLPPWLASEQTLDTFLAAFRGGTLPGAAWTHGAHVAMAAAVLWDTPVIRALDSIRDAIKRYNVSQGGENTESSGYHETLTRLWLGVIAAALAGVPTGSTRLDAVCHAYRAFARRSAYHRDWYAFDVVKSTQARREWVAPDGARVGPAAAIFGG